ncbi:MAG: peptidoglycan D,D-transpeptidase FtsI family protein [Actinomycetota bacterium]
MNTTIRRVGIAMLVLFVGLVAQLTYLQLVRADELKNDPNNIRVFLKDYSRPRGLILSSEGDILAQSLPTDDDLEQVRIYPPETAQLFAHVVGYQSVNFGNVGMEAEYNDQLVGRDVDLALTELRDVFSGRDVRGNVVLTMSRQAQQLAADGLAGRRGAVVVLDVVSGGIVAAYSNPTFDPNTLSTHDTGAASDAFRFLNAHPDKPLLQRSWREIYAPGSTFKVVTSGVGLENPLTPADDPPYTLTLDEPVYPSISELDLPLTDRTLENFGGDTCGGNLRESFLRSCNTTFGRIGLDLGDRLAGGIENYGVSTDPPNTDLRPELVRSIGPEPGTFQRNAPLFAQAAIGQGEVAVTPLEMAMIAQSVANGGVMMVPHVLDHVENSDGEDVRDSGFTPREYSRAMSSTTAAQLTELMVDVVNNGTGTRAQIAGVQVAGKTGTAQVEGEPAHAWFIAFAPAQQPHYAIAVLVENGGDLTEATGGRVAAPIAQQVLAGLLGR